MATSTAGTSGAVEDHETAEAERAAQEEQERLEAQAAGEQQEPAPEPDDEELEPEQASTDPAIALDGQLSFSSVGGKSPTSATVRLTGGRIDIPSGQLKKGEDVILRVVARVNEVAFVDELDPQTKRAVGCERRHKARIVHVAVAEE